MRLVSCGGRFDHATGHYRDNIIVYAPDGLLASRPGDSTVGPAVLVAAWCCCPPASPNLDPEPQLPGD